MKEGLVLGQNLVQTQTLAPLQVQFVRLLEMNTPAIEDEVRRRLDENPALETVDGEDIPVGESYNESAEDLQRADYASDDDVPVHPVHSHPGSTVFFESGEAPMTLAEDLKHQLDENTTLDDRTRALAEYIIGNLDDNGRMTRSLSAIADDISMTTGLMLTRDDLLGAFDAVRALDPAGVGAVDLRDCLLLQLSRREKTPPVILATDIVDRFFDLFVARQFERLRHRTDSSPSEFDAAIAVIRGLNPKPGGSGGGAEWQKSDPTQHIAPDFIVEPDPSDPTGERFLISLTQRLPELALARSYRPESEGEHVPVGERYESARAFIRSRAQEATEFMDILKRRTDTLMQVITAIVDIQRDFFRSEDAADIRPMVLRDIAARTGRDMSVISRATAGKYVATPGGIYPLKMFFNEAPGTDADVSSHRILKMIQSLIDAEDKTSPLSDDALTAELKNSGIDIARRTVAKYREQLHIPNSRSRRAPR